MNRRCHPGAYYLRASGNRIHGSLVEEAFVDLLAGDAEMREAERVLAGQESTWSRVLAALSIAGPVIGSALPGLLNL